MELERDGYCAQGWSESDQKAIREQLVRILNSGPFHQAQRRQRFLEYIVNEALAGRGERLKGYNVAQAVFDRPETFDPNSTLSCGSKPRACATGFANITRPTAEAIPFASSCQKAPTRRTSSSGRRQRLILAQIERLYSRSKLIRAVHVDPSPVLQVSGDC